VSVRVRSLAIAAIAFGVLAAALVALVVPTRSEGERATPAKQPIVVLPGKPQPRQRGMLYLAPERGSVHIDGTLRDPRGGPPFAVRVFRARRLALAGSPPGLEHARLLGHDLCAQLGRIYRGRFGWLDARNRFKPAAIGYRDAPTVCGDRWRDERSAPELRLTTLITDPERTTAKATTSVAWGFAGTRARTIALKGFSRSTADLSRRGAFLVAARRDARAAELFARFGYRGRPAVELSFAPTLGPRLPRNLPKLVKPIPGTGVIEARAPDPGGGVAWGVLGYRTNRGSYCVNQPGRIVGNRVGNVNFVLDTFDDVWEIGRQCGASAEGLPPDSPVAIGSMFGAGLMPSSIDPTVDPDGGRTALRTLPGRTVLYGVAKKDVRSVTLSTPRDVRTLIPSARTHSFVAVYDGTFPTGNLKLTATMADGSTKTIRQMAGFG
jgi:hypothetical protein